MTGHADFARLHSVKLLSLACAKADMVDLQFVNPKQTLSLPVNGHSLECKARRLDAQGMHQYLSVAAYLN